MSLFHSMIFTFREVGPDNGLSLFNIVSFLEDTSELANGLSKTWVDSSRIGVNLALSALGMVFLTLTFDGLMSAFIFVRFSNTFGLDRCLRAGCEADSELVAEYVFEKVVVDVLIEEVGSLDFFTSFL